YARPSPVRLVTDEELHPPRIWVVRPRGFTGASELRWDAQPAVEWSGWDQLTPLYRALDKPLMQAFPVSHVEQAEAPLDRRVAVFRPPGQGAPATFRAKLAVPYADRWRIALRLFALHELPAVQLDGKTVALPDGGNKDAPLRAIEFAGGALAAGGPELAFAVPDAKRSLAGLDSLRLVPDSPFAHAWWIAPPVAADSKGTVEDAMPIEAQALAATFDPAAAGWKQATTGDEVPLGDLVSHQDQTLAYLFVFVHA